MPEKNADKIRDKIMIRALLSIGYWLLSIFFLKCFLKKYIPTAKTEKNNNIYAFDRSSFHNLTVS